MSPRNPKQPAWLAEALKPKSESKQTSDCGSESHTSVDDDGLFVASMFVEFLVLAFALAVIGSLLTGCNKPIIVLRPGAPMLVTGGEGTLRVSAWDESNKTLVDYGTIDAASLGGWTLSIYDWSAEGEP